ncbi:MAG: hypothetical protein ChlgKO_04430 [Chlamydiales bacterium]
MIAILILLQMLSSPVTDSNVIFSQEAVTKKFENPRDIDKEKKAYNFIHRAEFTHISAPYILQTTDHELTMTYAPGIELSELIENADLDLLKKAVRKTALGFSELHTKTNAYKTKVAYSYNVPELEQQAAVIHGDPHPGNLFYDEATDKLIFIDLIDMAPSLQGQRGGPLARDAIYARNYIKLKAEFSGRSNREIATLMKTFDANYTFPISNKSRNYYTGLFNQENTFGACK